jgi:hypothetical protein
MAWSSARNCLLRFQNSETGSFTPVNAGDLAIGSTTLANTVAPDLGVALRMNTMR